MSARTDMLPAFFRAVERHGLIRPGDAVLAAVSGGGDSVALLHLLAGWSRRTPIRVTVAHVNHGLRGIDSDADQRFVEDLSRRLGWPCRVLHPGDPAASAAGSTTPGRKAGSVSEESLRRERHRLLREAARLEGCSRIALGHTMDDQAETVLMRFIRGTGRRGLSGMAHATPEGLIRPLLGMRREQLRDWLASLGETWREDRSNVDPRFLRNRVRARILPALAECNPAIVRVLARGAALMREEDRFLDALAWRSIEGAVRTTDEGAVVRAAALAALPGPIALRAARLVLARAGGDPRGARSSSAAHLVRLASGGSLARRGLAGGLHAERHGDEVRVERAAGTTPAPGPFFMTMTIPGEATLPVSGGVVTARLVPPGATLPPAGEAARACLDAERLGPVVTIRSRRPGDRFHPLGGPGPRRLKEFLIDGKIPRSLRDRIPLIEGPAGIAWVVGQRIGEPYRLTGATRRVAVLECTRVDLQGTSL